MTDVAIVKETMAGLVSMNDDLERVKKAISALRNYSSLNDGVRYKIKVSGPKAFDGECFATKLENFLWDVDQYFKSSKIPNDEQINITSIYLHGDANFCGVLDLL